MTDGPVASVAREAQNNTFLRALARVGFAINGLLHLLIGSLAIAIAIGSGTSDADESGAFRQLATSPGGVFVLWTVVVGLFALGLWLLLGAFRMHGVDPKRKWTHRFGEVGKAAVYFFLAVTALTFAVGGKADSAESTSDASAKILSAPGGVFLLLAAGILVFTIGAYFVYKGIAKKFTSDISVPSGPGGRAVIILGVVGYVAKGIALVVAGILIVVAAVTLDPSKSTGLDGALKTLAALPFGVVILIAVGIGLIAYGVYGFVRSWRARL